MMATTKKVALRTPLPDSSMKSEAGVRPPCAPPPPGYGRPDAAWLAVGSTVITTLI